ncbi:MAG TPA: NfeD family protein [Thermomicrobiales bacterium]|nr:NfeD family protein [Thermomicrobiales bacterium]
MPLLSRWMIGALLIVAGMSLLALPQQQAAASSHAVYVIVIDGEIELGIGAYLKRVLREADENGAVAVILEINTPGGRLDAALEMRNAILDSPVEPIAFINREAFSAGALIALATSRVYMTSGAVYGAATPVDGAGEPGSEKVISAVRSVFRSTAELRGRDPLVAEAMVDPDIAVPGLIETGKLLTLSTAQALEWGFADAQVANRADMLEQAGLGDAVVVETSIEWAERLVRLLTNPLIASLLISLGSLMILLDLFTAGFGPLGLTGIGMIATFFWGHFLAGLAGWEGVLLVILGIALLGVEVFIIPGFGVAGVLGIASILGGMFISMIGGEIVTDEDIQRAGFTVAGAFVVMLAGGAVMLTLLPQASRFRSLVLKSQVGVPDTALTQQARRRRRWWRAEQPDIGPPVPEPAAPAGAERDGIPSLVGARGTALADLRPGGFARIGGVRVDVVTQGDYIPAGAEVEVIADEGYRRVVRLAEQ